MAKAPKPIVPTSRPRGLEQLEALRDALPAAPYAARDAELEAVIAEDPGDPARYLVYADWLQLRGDARGLLIALHHAAHQAPRDAARAEAAAALLHEHRYALLGRLEPYTRPRPGHAEIEVELDWFMGFIRRARLRLATDDRVAEALACLLETPSAWFLQELVIEPLETRRAPQAGPLVALLLERPPRSLRLLQIGKPGAWEVPPEVRAALPRLARDPAVVWAEATAAIAAQRKLKIELDAAALPAPRPRGGAAIPVDMTALLTGIKAELDKQRPLGVLAALPQVFTADSLDQLAAAMGRQWLALGEDTARWSFAALGPLGGDHTAALLGEHLERWSHARCMQALEHLRRIGSDAAIAELAALALRPNGYRPRREVAREQLAALAAARGQPDADRLLDRVCPLAPTPRALDAQRWWLESLIVSGHRLSVEDFRRCVLGHPVRLPLARTLVWGEFAGARLVRMFLAGDGAPVRFDGRPYAFELSAGEGHGVGLVHPAELEPRERQVARVALAGAAQAVPQLERPVFRLTDEERAQDRLTRFERRRVGISALFGALTQRDWYVHEQGDRGVAAFGKDFARDRAIAVAGVGRSNAAIDEVVVRRRDPGGTPRKLGELHAVTLSELLWDLEVAHRHPEPSAPPAPPAPPSSSSPPSSS